jgi:2-amino-4-hydroxy-6-hydroxymethyldihydropteridine diphosphokinase/dihydropteroate synthase
MLHGGDLLWLGDRINYLRKLGIKKTNIIIDPGLGFGKTKYENVRIVKRLKLLHQFECEILLGPSRKSFISAYSHASVEDRDLETIAMSFFASRAGDDYLRVHNVKDHMRFFVASHCIENA